MLICCFVQAALLVSQSVMLGYLTESIVSADGSQNAYFFGAGIQNNMYIHKHMYTM